MACSRLVLFCLTLLVGRTWSYEASFLNQGEQCVLLSKVDCDKNCTCTNYITFSPKSWYNMITSIFKRQKCDCNECRQEKTVRCVNGLCDVKNSKCVCNYCWVGETCDIYQNKHVPKFASKAVDVSIPKSHPFYLPITNVIARDDDAQYCNSEKCPCGKVFYKLNSHESTFWIDKVTGEISLIHTPLLSRYVLLVSAGNYHGFENFEGAQLNVTVSIFDDQPRVRSQDNGDGINAAHHRFRRSVSAQADAPLVVLAVPELTTTYYFNQGDKIKFAISAKHNKSSGAAMTSLSMKVRGKGLTLSDGKGEGSYPLIWSTSGATPTFTISSLSPGQTAQGIFSATVQNNIEPLESLIVKIDYEVQYDGKTYKKENVSSSPTIYGVFPNITLSRSTYGDVATYGSVDMTMHMSLPLMNYYLLIELTTNVECFIFMQVSNVAITLGTDVTIAGSSTPSYTSSKNSNNLNDRAVLDLGNIVVANGSQQYIEVKYTIEVKDHINVANMSTHYAGIGVQAGEKLLWVEQQSINISKTEPSLGIIVDTSKIDNSSRLFIGDIITVAYQVGHTSTSEADAKNVKIALSADHLELADTSGVTTVNATYFEKDIGSSFKQGSLLNASFVMKVKNTVTPLISIPIKLILTYENKDSVKKFPTVEDVRVPIVGTPNITLSRTDGSDMIVFGDEVTYQLSILLVKMRSPIKVEIVTPKVNTSGNGNGTALMHLLSCQVESVGSNIKDAVQNPAAVFFSTTSDKNNKDEATLDLGTPINDGTDVSDIPANRINIKFTVIVNEVQKMSNLTIVKVGAGVIAKPRMVWVMQIAAKANIKADRGPRFNFTHKAIGNGDIYNHNVSIVHKSASDQYAYNLTFEYYLPPYVQFQSVSSSPSTVKQVDTAGGRSRFMLEKPMKFLDAAISHSITVKINRTKCPKTGTFDYTVPVALTYVNYEGKRWQYWRSIKRSLTISESSSSPTIAKKSKAHDYYYGRGFFLHKARNTIYVCMNMHLPTSRPACYKSTDNGVSWMALDSRVGSVIGFKDDHLYAIARNQRSVIKLNMANNDFDEYEWLLVHKKASKALLFNEFIDISGVTSVEPPTQPAQHPNGNWGGNGEWLYYRPTTSDKWEKRAKWRL